MTATTMNLSNLLEQQARLTPSREAVVQGGMRLTYAQVNAMANQVAGGLRALGLSAGDHIALSCPNLPYFPIAYYGILKMGGVVVPLNVLLKPREIAYHLTDSQAKALLVFEGTAELPMAQMARAACDEVTSCAHMIVMTTNPAGPSPVERSLTLGQIMHTQAPVFASHAPAPDDTAVILYTSGTTGQPKGAELTHFNMVTNAIVSRDMMAPTLDSPLAGTSRQLITLPLFHSTGQTAQMNAAVSGGQTIVLLPRFDAAAVLKTMVEERITCWVGVPTMYWALLQHARQSGMDVSAVAASLRICCSGGAPMPVAVLEDFGKTFGVLSKERCTGDVAKRTGNEYMYQELASQNIEDLRTAGVKKIVTSCPHCVKTIGHDYQQMGYEVEAVHSATLVEELTRDVMLEWRETDNVTYHDPCYLGRYADVHAEPRALLERFGAKVTEPVRHGDNPFCCGAGGGLLFEEHESGKRISQERFDQLQATGAGTVVMACPFCSIMLKGAQASTNAPVQMVDLMTYVDGKMKSLKPKCAPEDRSTTPAQADTH